MEEHDEIMKIASEAKPVNPQQVYNLVETVVRKSHKELATKIDELAAKVEILIKRKSKE